MGQLRQFLGTVHHLAKTDRLTSGVAKHFLIRGYPGSIKGNKEMSNVHLQCSLHPLTPRLVLTKYLLYFLTLSPLPIFFGRGKEVSYFK